MFTTRPDTLFGATFMVLAPEHPLVDELVPAGGWPEGTKPAWTGGAATPEEAVTAYRRAASRKNDIERQTEGKDKTGVFTGGWATNPVTGTRIPVFVADYVLMGYGTGAIMAVPGQDERDWDFAKAFDLPIIRTVQPSDDHDLDTAFTGAGPAINSSNDELSLDGLDVADAKERITAWLQEKGLGEPTVTYKLRDWLFSRQRYWGEPFPVVFDEDGIAHGVPDSMLPVELPEVPDYSPKTYDPDDASSEPEPPLSRVDEWVHVDLDLGDGRGTRRYRRETNTMPNWAGSCWYYLRYLDPANSAALVDPDNESYWMGPRAEPVAGAARRHPRPGRRRPLRRRRRARRAAPALRPLLAQGAARPGPPQQRRAVPHLLQPGLHPGRRLQGRAAASTSRPRRSRRPPTAAFTWQGQPVTREFGKIGKSLKNMVSPDEMYAAFGADTFRLYEMGLGPLEQSKPWDTRAVVGSQRFLQRLWRNVVDEETGEVVVADTPMDAATTRVLHRTIDAVRTDYAGLAFNTAIARLTELNNALTKLDGGVPREAAESIVLMVAPMAPHIAEELWARMGHEESLVHADFPVADPALLVEDTVTCVVQVKGKVRDRLEVPSDITEDALRELALASAKVQAAVPDGIRTVIVRAPKLVNVVPD